MDTRPAKSRTGCAGSIFGKHSLLHLRKLPNCGIATTYDCIGEGILYAESCRIEELNLSLVYEFVLKNINEKACVFAYRFMNAGTVSVPVEMNSALLESLQRMAESLKAYCEKTGES